MREPKTHRFGDLVIKFDEGNPGGPHWCTDSYGDRKCWIERDTLVYDGHAVYGPAVHADPDQVDAKGRVRSYKHAYAALRKLSDITRGVHIADSKRAPRSSVARRGARMRKGRGGSKR